MKIKKGFFAILVILSIFSPWSVCYGLDTELYVLSGVNVPPNVLVILDNSASMDEVVQDLGNFEPSFNYDEYPYNSSTYTRNAVYVKSGNSWNFQWPDYNTITCVDLRDNYLALYGMANNYTNTDCTPSIRNKDFRTGNYLNYLAITGQGADRSRFGLALGIIHSYMNTTPGVRFTLMVFNDDSSQNGPKTVKYNATTKEEYVDNPDGSEDAIGGRVIGFVDESGNGKTALFNAISGLKNETWSPLAETLAMTETYFKSGLNGFSTPIQYKCQKNYVFIISDGNPTKDTGNLAEIASHLFNLDLSRADWLGKANNPQNIMTYTVRFTPVNQLMTDTATKGGGKNWYVASSQSFSEIFQIFIADVLKNSTSYVAPVVPISQMERTSAANRMYLAMFQPTETSFWKGNIKKYGISTENTDQYQFGDILDATGAPAIETVNSFSRIKDSAKSYWDLGSQADGAYVDKGGVGAVLLARNPDTRKIYTYFTGNTTNLTDSSNAFSLANTYPEHAGGKISTTTLGDVTTVGDRDNIIKFVYGWNPYNEMTILDTDHGKYSNGERDWILGAFIHSRPLVVHYDQTHSVIFAGANDGMLHAFDDESGEELWAFIPPCLLGSLKYFGRTDVQFFVDGAPRAYIERDSNGTITTGILIIGLRRGGTSYIALDIKNRLQPAFLWEISPARTGYGELGQTWSTPLIGKIKDPNNPGLLKSVAFFGGGYDYTEYNTTLGYNYGNEDSIPPGTDIKGRAVYVIDISTGNCIWSYSYADNSTMKYSIPSDIARVDTNGDGAIDRLYVGDTGGQMWRFDISDPNPANWKNAGKVKVIFNSNPGSSDKRKIFYPPEVTLEKGNYEMLFFGTGDREHPKYRSETQGIVDRLYGVKDKNPTTPLTDSDLVDVMTHPLQPGSDTENGWYITLNSEEEKCLANAVIFYGVVYYTTFVPSQGGAGDLCFMSAGNGRLYAVDYMTANAALDLDGSGILTAGDLSKEIGVSIPSGIVITFIQGVTLAYGGEGGGVFRPPTPTSKTIFPLSWRVVF